MCACTYVCLLFSLTFPLFSPFLVECFWFLSTWSTFSLWKTHATDPRHHVVAVCMQKCQGQPGASTQLVSKVIQWEETCLCHDQLDIKCFQTKDDFHMLLLRIDWLGQDGIRRTAVFMQGRQQITLKSDPPKIWGLKKGVRIYIIKKLIHIIYIPDCLPSSGSRVQLLIPTNWDNETLSDERVFGQHSKSKYIHWIDSYLPLRLENQSRGFHLKFR